MRLSMWRDAAERARALILGTNWPRGEADLRDTATTLAEAIVCEAAARLARDGRGDEWVGLPHVLSTRAPLDLPAVALRSVVGVVLLEVVPAEDANP